MTKTVSVSFLLLSVVFSVCLTLSNLLAAKVITVFGMSATAALIVFPVSYIINDAVTEVWGYRKARMMIWMAFAMNFLAIVFMQLSVMLPPAPYWTGQEAYAGAFRQTPRIACASLIAFLCGSFINACIMSRMKVRTRGKGFGIRAAVSTLFGETADSCLFFSIAFAGIAAWREILIMIVAETVLKSAYEIVILPVTTMVVRYIKRKEQTDIFDDGISYRIWAFK
ncbi:MAG: queuosine precursor transporter [Bacteroidales bacterium]|jgi:uncharacterized integral membrane protein (TIGR00697 family)|nr:queuosine precursor transporter [Bacteroidales bacterium]